MQGRGSIKNFMHTQTPHTHTHTHTHTNFFKFYQEALLQSLHLGLGVFLSPKLLLDH
jgi:hypothetical protein